MGVMAEEEPHSFISRADRLRLPRTLNSGRIERLRVFRSRITDWATPSPVIFEEPIIVEIKVRRERRVGKPKIVGPGLTRQEIEEILKKKVTEAEWLVYKHAVTPIELATTEDERVEVWYDSLVVDHFHPKVAMFEDLLDQKTRQGYTVTVKDAVLAYMLVFLWGRKSVIAGFLSSKYADGPPAFPEFQDLPRLREMVGENLSRLHADGFIDAVPLEPKIPPPPPYYVPRPPEETLYVVHPERRQIQLKRGRWWERGF